MKNNHKIGIVGLGYVGLPLAVEFGKKYNTIAYDINKTKKLLSTQRIAAGDKPPLNLKKGEVARIFTGARVPANCKTIIMQENVTIKNKYIIIKKTPINNAKIFETHKVMALCDGF